LDKYLKDLINSTDLTRNEPLKDIVYEALRCAILSGSIPVGTPINQKLIADYLNVSRTPIRAAINRLKHEKLLEETVHGVAVKLVNVDNVSELFQIFLALETIALTHAMHNMQPEHFEQIEYMLTNTIHPDDGQDTLVVERSFIDYNHILISYARMPQLEMFIDQLEDYMLRLDNMSGLSELRRDEILCQYVVLVQCMKQKDDKALALVLAEHFAIAQSFIIERMNVNDNNTYAIA